MKLLLPLAFIGTLALAQQPIAVTGTDGKPLNLGFEDGTLRDWTTTGEAFAKQPVKGPIDPKRPYGAGKVSNHQGDYWIGGFEILRDDPKGTLTSVPFKVTQPWASFLIAGGSLPGTRVEVVTKDDGKVIHTARGANTETLARSVVDLRKLEGRDIFIRIVDEETVGWGHVNFDDFVFHAQEPKFPAERLAQKPGPKIDPNLKPDEIQYAGLPAEKAAQVATVPAGYELKVFAAEPDIINPIAFCMDDRARIWVVEGMTYPQRAKTEPGAPEWLGGADRILVFEDTDGDGKADKRTVFMEGLNLVSGIEVGFGGVFVGASPNLIFIPVENGDDPKPGKVEVLLDGWGYQDTHETLNTFKWGPDGWLYGCHGVFTHSKVGKPGTPDEQRVKLNAGIWRYQPQRHEFEVFAHGTSNPWGIDWNADGDLFAEACVIPHLFHIIQGALPAAGRAAFRPAHLRRHQDHRRSPPFPRRDAARRQQPQRRRRRRPRARGPVHPAAPELARRHPRQCAHGQHPRRAHQHGRAGAQGQRLRRAPRRGLHQFPRQGEPDRGPPRRPRRHAVDD
jgi:putative membrane-bound dehydrogenase-like protein